MKKSLIYLVAFATLLSLFPVVNLNFASAQESCDPDALRPVSYGQRGPAVKKLQTCLMEAGYEIPAGATGYYGSQTAAAVLQFYRDQGNEAGVALRGRRFGPQGIAALKEALASTEEPFEDQTPGEDQTPQGTEGTTPSQQQNQLASLLPLILALTGVQLDATQTAALSQALANNDMTTAMTIILQARGRGDQQTQEGLTPGVPGFLTTDRDPSVTGVIVRESESARVFGLRFRADSGAVKVTSLVLRWPNSNPAAPSRILSKVEILDDAGNVLVSKSPSEFLTDSSFQYYLPVSGLNIVVQPNTYKSIFVRVTLVGTLPSVTPSWPRTISFQVNSSDIRGVDGTGATISSNTSPSDLSFTADASVSGSAYFVTALDASSPREGYIFATDLTNGRAENVPALIYNLTPRNDNLLLTEISGSVSNTSTVRAVRVNIGNMTVFTTPSSDGSWSANLASYNVVINRDQVQRITVGVDLTGAANTPVTFTVSVSTTTARNTLGDTKDYTTAVASPNLYFVLGGPTFSVSSKLLTLRGVRDGFAGNIVTTTIDTIQYEVSVTANNIDVFIPTSSPVYVEILKPDNTLVATATLNVTNVDPSNTVLENGRYKVPANNRVTFTFTRTLSQNVAGNLTLRAWVKSFDWSYSNSASLVTASFMANDMNTWATNPPVSPQ